METSFPVFSPQLTSPHRLTDSVNDQDEQPFDWSSLPYSFQGCATTLQGATLPSDMASVLFSAEHQAAPGRLSRA